MNRILLLLFIATSAIAAEVGSPKWIIESFFIADRFPNSGKYLTGEMERFIDKPNYGSNVKTNFTGTARSIGDESYWIVTYSDGQDEFDLYCFLKKEEDCWKLEAIRGLALPAIFDMHMEALSNKDRTEAEEWDYQNCLLMKKSDSQLKRFLKDNIDKFEEMVSSPDKRDDIAHTLHLRKVSSFYEGTSSLNILIGGMIDNTVGFLYLPDGQEAPKPAPTPYIYIEHVTGNWWVYKTT